jgi:hypothetical protein
MTRMTSLDGPLADMEAAERPEQAKLNAIAKMVRDVGQHSVKIPADVIPLQAAWDWEKEAEKGPPTRPVSTPSAPGGSANGTTRSSGAAVDPALK